MTAKDFPAACRELYTDKGTELSLSMTTEGSDICTLAHHLHQKIWW